MKVFIGQLNTTVGALYANAEAIRRTYEDGVRAGADVVLVPELAITGYPARDLLDRPHFIQAALQVRDSLVAMTKDAPGATTLIFGCPIPTEDWCGKPLHNAAIIARNGEILLQQHKILLPTYDVFDELRYFEPGESVQVVEIAGRRVGVSICEDYWFDDELFGKKLYRRNPVDELVRQGAEVLLNISASPFNAGKGRARREIFSKIAERYEVPLVYVNQVGGNDELLFDGASVVFDKTGRTIFHAPAFEEHCSLVPLEAVPCPPTLPVPRSSSGSSEFLGEERTTAAPQGTPRNPEEPEEPAGRAEEPEEPAGRAEEIGRALILGLRDYIRKCGFSDVVIGLSGGIDSALTAAIAVEALGREHVTGIAMPSQFSSQHSIDDARALAGNLGIAFHVVPIAGIYAPYETAIDALFGTHTFDTTNENVQARIRGNILMAWSNRNGAMVISTGNKSELAVGYCTLYGDMCGGLSLLGDVYKTMVYRVSQWINREREIIPHSTLTKAPSAELRPNQTDQDTLPPYDILDAILKLYIEEWLEVDQIAERGFDRDLVARVLKLVDTNEFKRRQGAPTVRVSSKAFGSGRDMPIAQRWRREPAKQVR